MHIWIQSEQLIKWLLEKISPKKFFSKKIIATFFVELFALIILVYLLMGLKSFQLKKNRNYGLSMVSIYTSVIWHRKFIEKYWNCTINFLVNSYHWNKSKWFNEFILPILRVKNVCFFMKIRRKTDILTGNSDTTKFNFWIIFFIEVLLIIYSEENIKW